MQQQLQLGSAAAVSEPEDSGMKGEADMTAAIQLRFGRNWRGERVPLAGPEITQVFADKKMREKHTLIKTMHSESMDIT
ncbi:MAG: hypothetical protein ACLFST_10450 [Spirochaetia bacterium]